ncbi:MAG: hypothetical protein AVDCRST_MAG07-2003, partial [uncultured Frankineae bacterium]
APGAGVGPRRGRWSRRRGPAPGRAPRRRSAAGCLELGDAGRQRAGSLRPRRAADRAGPTALRAHPGARRDRPAGEPDHVLRPGGGGGVARRRGPSGGRGFLPARRGSHAGRVGSARGPRCCGGRSAV